MRFKLYSQNGARNSGPVFQAFASGIRALGHELVNDHEDAVVIWSVLWHGKMLSNKPIYNNAIPQKPVFILEVGSLKRGVTWKVSVNNINRLGICAHTTDLDATRPDKLQISLSDYNKKRKPDILIATQHDQSLLWHGQPKLTDYIQSIISNIREYSDRNIIVRPHPRCAITNYKLPHQLQIPKPLFNTYDGYNIDYAYHAVINHNSGPGIQAIIDGTPIICDESSLASPVSNQFNTIESPIYHDRLQWFIEICHTEWTLDEIASGIPLDRLLKLLN